MKLFCVRHGEAEAVSTNAMGRPLTAQGKIDVEKVASYLYQGHLHVGHIMHSPKLRAKQTAEILAKGIGIEQMTECAELLSGEEDVSALQEMIQTWNDNTMLVGHLPFMSKLISALVIQDANYYPIVNFTPSTVVCLDYFENQRWIISWLLHPNIVPQIN